ncbi:MAG TPA: RNB domain-containing ribonuclease [Methanolinea sp.]|nr:RNB domain-containing ribonuclease [Methanolinea sp.]
MPRERSLLNCMKKHRIDLKAIARKVMEKYGFVSDFPPAVIRETSSIEEVQSIEPDKDTRDLRSLLWSSIDNSDSEDLDQVEYCESRSDGEIRVFVAIADVDFFVRKGSNTDRHAAFNGTSVYLGVETFPMLPDHLSKGVSSLLPGKDRRAVVIEYTVLPDGTVKHGAIFRAIVKNHARLVYEEVGDWLEGKAPIPSGVSGVPGLEEQIRLQAEVARRLRAHRMKQGALDLETIEAQPVMEGGAVRGLVIQEQNAARQIIEEFMVAANGTMVHVLGAAGVPMVQRVVRVPKNWDGIVRTAAQYGFHLAGEPDSKALARFLDTRRRADPERFPDLSLTIVKLMGPGEYVPFVPGDTPIGHFALAVLDYTHSTAPNRRYVDIINQRLLKAVLDGKPMPYSAHELAGLAEHLTDRDKAAEKAARFMRKVAAAVILRDRIGQTFDAIVTGAADKGTYVRLFDPPAEGRVVQGERGLFVGNKVKVRLIDTDPELGYVDFACVGRDKR